MTSLFLSAGEHSMVRMDHIFILPASVTGRLGCFHFLAVVSSAAMDMAELACTRGVGHRILWASAKEEYS